MCGSLSLLCLNLLRHPWDYSICTQKYFFQLGIFFFPCCNGLYYVEINSLYPHFLEYFYEKRLDFFANASSDVYWGCHFESKSWTLLAACRIQYWDNLGQNTNKAGNSPTHQQTCCLKTSWAHSYLQAYPLTWSSPPKTQDSTLPTNGQAAVPSTRKDTSF